MKKLSMLVVLAVAVVFAASAPALITGSAHDFNGDPWNTTGELCRPCHTPHNAYPPTGTGAQLVPLWNHTSSATTGYTMYSSPTGTLDGTMATAPGSVSLACLSCHDGTVALDSFGGVTGGTNITGSTLLSKDLSNDHPISFSYQSSITGGDTELKATTELSGLPGGGSIADDLLFTGNMECASCHDVHNTPGIAGLLVKANTASALCLTCHIK